ncbi:hypothetical protein NA57DRAFT_71724 [Rhizodiscina lignyota]|uniref:Cell wall proline rich protein n=1 Tax=Rhizodiscina lignyota TaxID=1504668 RepID=A0A9P4IQM0_9PEZI|nr:hypothetical protein NA57DRAFT_71724 [Rhizodiscina lignyota]
MAEISTTLPPTFSDFDNQSMGSAVYSHRSGSSITSTEMIPNPDFTFPARAPDSDALAPSSRRPMSAQMSKPTHAQSRSISQRRSVSALPNFTFNPSGMIPASQSPKTPPPQSPPHSPSLPIPTTPSSHMRHRRGGSEFIGGDGKGGGMGLMSTSPTKGDGVLPAPSSSTRLGPPAGRRGHAHRRSGAISCHDLQTILQPTSANAQPRGGSAPVTPLENDNKFFAPQSRRSASQTELRMTSTDDQATPSDGAESPPKGVVPRTRVGFSERVEYIRPLSTISSETESSLSTIRGHSVNGSLSSVISAGAASPSSSVKLGRPSLQTTFEDENMGGRPSTADDALESIGSTREQFGRTLMLPERPKSAAATESPTATTPPCGSPVKSKSQQKKRFSGWFDQRRNSRPQSAMSLSSRSEPSLIVTPPDTPALPQEGDDSQEDTVDERALGNKIDCDRRPRKVRSWAHSLIPLRHRPKTPTEGQSSPVEQEPPPPVPPTPAGVDFNVVANFDADNTIDIVTSPIQATTPQYGSNFMADSTPSDGSFGSDAMSPIIDLDAALGPFNTPPIGSRTFPRTTITRRSMHSGSFGTGLPGLGQQHRRTESAPELAPFDMRMKMGNASTMADVFEEDEEEEYDSKKPVRQVVQKASSAEALDGSRKGAHMHDSATDKQKSGTAWTFDAGLGISTDHSKSAEKLGSVSVERASIAPLQTPNNAQLPESTTLIRDPSPVEVVEDYEEPRASSLTKDSDSTITPTMSEDETKQPPPLMKLNLPLAPPSIMTPDTLASSPLSTPDYHRGSRNSFETPRVGTATSSITDNRTVNSSILGEPGPEYRVSVDDVPSLTSSRSTMTSPQHPLAQYSQGMPDTRSISVSSIPSAGPERTRKRGSIGSLSRLMGGSFAEKSKLSIESRPQSEHGSSRGEEGKSNKKRNRISRLMMFWKAKEKEQLAS